MRIINKKYLLVILLVGVILTGVIVLKPKEIIKLDNVILKQEVNNKTFAMYREEGDNYIQVEDNKFPEGYELNLQLSKCIDNNGNEIENALYTKDNQIGVKSNKSLYCYLYFDKKRIYILMAHEGLLKNPDTILTNMLGEEGNFENEDDFNSYYGDTNSTICEADTNLYKYGTHSCKIPNRNGIWEQYIITKNAHSINNTHVYYAQVSYYVKLNKKLDPLEISIDFYWPFLEEPRLGNSGIRELEKWNVAGVIGDRKSLENKEDRFRIDFNYNEYYDSNSVEIRFDGAMLIDLTESYGDSYPSVDELNQLYYFDNSVEIKEVVAKDGVFELSNEISKVECNNDASWEINNTNLTIKSKEDYTVCMINS